LTALTVKAVLMALLPNFKPERIKLIKDSNKLKNLGAGNYCKMYLSNIIKSAIKGYGVRVYHLTPDQCQTHMI
jgi:hypothetical protein